MVTPGSIAVPGALLMINTDLTESTQNRLVIQLHIDETITGEEFDVRFAADPDYPTSVRALRRRIMVVRDHRDATNRDQMDIVFFLKNGMLSVTKNCFSPPGQTYLLKDIYWGAFCIYNTDINRTCNSICPTCGGLSYTDGYAPSPYYPATYDPAFPTENHPYYQTSSTSTFGSCCCESTLQLCGAYYCNSSGCIPLLDCRLVKA
jgi:hypothetical protein